MKDIVLKYALQNAVRHDGKASADAVIAKVLGTSPLLKSNIKELQQEVSKAINEINSLTIEEQEKRLSQIAPELLEEHKKDETKTLPELPDANKGIVMRIAPFPSGALHIGNAYTCIINDEYSKKYNGKLLLIIDDTIGSDEKPISKDAYKLIPEGLEWLGIKFERSIIYKSDRLEIYYEYAKELISKNKAYVCFCNAEKLRENRAKGIECSCRNNPIERNLKEFDRMINKKCKEGSAVLRIKTGMQDPNPAFRDRVLFRISEKSHPRVKKKYRAWPLLEFSWAVDDHLLGITHVIRGKELMIESQMEKYIWDILNWPSPVLIHSGLLQIEGIKISKSKARKEVESGEYTGWDDPRTWSLQSLKRRGFEPESIRKLFLSIGLTRAEITVPIESLHTENRRIIDRKCSRYFFIENPKKIKITGTKKMKVEVPLHPDFSERGHRKFSTTDEFYISDNLEQGKTYRFMNLFNFKDNEFISKEHDSNQSAKLIHWLPASENLVNIEVLMPDGTIKKGLGEKSLKKLKKGDQVQFIRFGFVKLDKKEKGSLTFWYTHN
ncbi:glutamate--tRNA ligase [Candidatus Woesearchaeota archaeon]|nr:glutamate--tRNA ligase [Candidatus Woesearchaeota archaeon]